MQFSHTPPVKNITFILLIYSILFSIVTAILIYASIIDDISIGNILVMCTSWTIIGLWSIVHLTTIYESVLAITILILIMGSMGVSMKSMLLVWMHTQSGNLDLGSLVRCLIITTFISWSFGSILLVFDSARSHFVNQHSHQLSPLFDCSTIFHLIYH